MSFQKIEPWRNEYYTEYVRTLPSPLTGKYTATYLHGQNLNDPHHPKGYSSLGYGGPVKPSDYLVIPLPREEHQELHSMGPLAWEKSNNVKQLWLSLKTMCKAIEDGVLVVDKDRAKELIKEYYETRNEN